MRVAQYILGLAITGLAMSSAYAHGNNWSLGVVIGNPYPPAVTYYAPPPVYYSPPPVTYYRAPGAIAYGYGAPNVIYQPVYPGAIQYSYGGGFRGQFGGGFGGGYGYHHHGHHH